MTGEAIKGRRVLAVGGSDRLHFLQNLVTNDLDRLTEGLVYSALLSPQGKYLADFFLLEDGESILIDVAEPLADPLVKRLRMYCLRANVTIEPTALQVSGGVGEMPDGALRDPRHASLGWRHYCTDEGAPPTTDRDAQRVAACIPESCIELIPNETYILEAGFERLNGVDFRKGCYVGQEVTARMKHKTVLKKGLATVRIEGAAPAGTPILTEDGRPAGTLFTQSRGQAIAHLRFDRARGTLRAGDAEIAWNGEIP